MQNIMRFPMLAALAFVSSSAFAAEVEAPGVPNFHQVNEHIFRGAQPTGQGWDNLAKLGVKVVIDLRRDNEDGNHSLGAEAKAVQAAGMRYVSVPMKGLVAPSEADISKVLALLNGPDPVFVHCKLGKDRTGTVIACYRISHDRWQNKKALEEAKAVGLHRVEVGMKSYISGFRSMAPAAGPAEAGAPATVATSTVQN
jgi:tyrosine-protein phosphatase SIW14